MSAFDAVLLYILWMIVLLLIYAGPRIPQALVGAKAIDSWERNKAPVDPPMFQRAKSAHLNCIENLPLFAGVVAIAGLMNQIAIADSVAAWVLYARVAQSAVHISGTSFIQIMLRATFFLIQVVLIGYIAVKLLMV
ncbi:MAPEG family protein [Sinimarinibacterium flocculans]|uniref:MAPEG family protein n=1 Tax=Sinimarinibacterium flocculans TaxID=985250 RepID=A0A318ECE3_9GAMM|nr:MAPEG family protein [Sinimarinibacterium flocculans]PXV65284.1 MAPEG family protein [Sinimarinibacterium flocculans]